VDDLAPDKRALRDEETAECNESFLLEFWQSVLDIARQVPFNHSAQTRLVQLAVELQKIPRKSIEVDDNSIKVDG
jgi:hypothetical protein